MTICGSLASNFGPEFADAGVVQTKISTEHRVIVGSTKSTSLMAGGRLSRVALLFLFSVVLYMDFVPWPFQVDQLVFHLHPKKSPQVDAPISGAGRQKSFCLGKYERTAA